jgi:CubicO group peptidase (beta-lactamase class C family)
MSTSNSFSPDQSSSHSWPEVMSLSIRFQIRRSDCQPGHWSTKLAGNRPRKAALRRAPIFLLFMQFTASLFAQPVEDDLSVQRRQFQAQEMIPARFGGWIFPIGNPPRLIWRDVDEVRRLGPDVGFQVRWFDADLRESTAPDKPGRWIAWVEGQAPNGTPLRRAFTFFALPQKIEPRFVPDLTVTLPKFPGPDAPPAWAEHQIEFDRAGKELLTRGLIDSEQGAILVAGISESKPLGRPKRFVESTLVANSDYHLALKLKLQGLADKVRPLHPARTRATAARVLRQAATDQAGVPEDAKAKIDDFCHEWVEATGEPFVTLVACKGVIVTHEAFGRDTEGEPIDRNYRCWLASITKTVTALMFSQLVDQGLIQLDAPLSTVFPDYPVNDPHVPTFRQCLNHTAGLSGHGNFGGMNHPHLENVVLNGIDINEPGKAHEYSGLGYELIAKAMEVVSGTSSVRLYHEHLFEPLGFGDVVLRNASSDCELTAMELAILGQWIANRGSYGDREFISPATFEKLLPQPLKVPGGPDKSDGLGMRWIRHRKPDAAADSDKPEDFLFSQQTVGHGSFSGCILVVDLEQQLVIAQVRRKFGDADSEWWNRFFQTIAEAITDGPE